MKKKVILIPLLVLVLGYAAMRILLGLREDTPRQSPPPRKKIVRAEVVDVGPVTTTITAYGRLASAQPVTLTSEVAGTLMKGDVPFQPAQSFERGDLLCKVDDRQVRLDLNSMKSDFLSALATVLPEIKIDFPDEFDTWQSYFDRFEFDRRLEPLPEVTNEQIKLFLSRFNVYKLYFGARNLGILLEKHYFRAPFRGSIVSADLRVGSAVRAGTRLGEIINLENLEVEVPVPTLDLEWIDHSKPVTFTSEEITGRWTGKIVRIGKSIDERTQTVPVFISVDPDGEELLISGVFLKAEIPGLRIPEAIAIPRKAVYEERFVYLVKNGTLDYRKLDIARKEDATFIATGGISDGDTLVVEVLQGVSPGMLAEPRLSGGEEGTR